MKPYPKSKLENPVLHFSSAVYKCENQVCKLLVRGSADIKNGEAKIMEGLVLCLQEKVPTSVVLEWLNRKNVRNAHQWALQYEKIQTKVEVAQQVIKKEITWNKAHDTASPPRMAKRSATVERRLIHNLAVYTVKKQKDEDEIVKKYKAEVEIVRGKNYKVNGC
jgi:hypothetical protein